jgi:hypothetical protein
MYDDDDLTSEEIDELIGASELQEDLKVLEGTPDPYGFDYEK